MNNTEIQVESLFFSTFDRSYKIVTVGMIVLEVKSVQAFLLYH